MSHAVLPGSGRVVHRGDVLGVGGPTSMPPVLQNGQNGKTATYTECQKFCLIGGGVSFKYGPT